MGAAPGEAGDFGVSRSTASDLLCPKCGQARITVVDSRARSDTVRRRRLCEGCEHRWTTIEVDPGDAAAVIHQLEWRLYAARKAYEELGSLLTHLEQLSNRYTTGVINVRRNCKEAREGSDTASDGDMPYLSQDVPSP